MIFLPKIDSVETVLAIRAKAMTAMQEGSTVVSWSVEGSSVNKVISMPVKEVLQECNDFLRVALPDIYGRRVKRTVPLYSGN